MFVKDFIARLINAKSDNEVFLLAFWFSALAGGTIVVNYYKCNRNIVELKRQFTK